METYTTIIEVLFVLLILALIYTVFKYPRDIFITLPVGILKGTGKRFYWTFVLITIPIWVPLYFIDRHFKWGMFKSIAKLDKALEDNDTADIEYDVERELSINFQLFDKYIITTASNGIEAKRAVVEGLETITASFDSIELSKHESLHIIRITGIDLYSFHFLVQWMQEEFKSSKNFGFAKNGDFSFFCTCDKKTLNNLIGETSNKEVYAYSLTEPQDEYLPINNSIKFRKRYTTRFFNQIIKNIQQVTTE